MHPAGTISTVIIVAAVLLFFLVGVAMIVIMDHKARLPGGFTQDPFTIGGMRRDHPVIAFLTAVILLAIIAVLVIELVVAATTSFGLLQGGHPPELSGTSAAGTAGEAARRFHRVPEGVPVSRVRRSVCFPCHDDFPHSKQRMVSALLNMHSQFAGCMTCHLDSKEVPASALSLRWLNDSGVGVKGRPYGTEVDPATGLPAQTDDYYSRIVPYRKDASGEQLLEHRERRDLKRKRHTLVTDKGRACESCHTDAEKSFIPYRALGFSEQRTRELTSLNLVGLVDKYKKFYFPAMRGAPPAAPKGAEGGPEESPAAVSRDPQKWWEQKYDRQKKTN